MIGAGALAPASDRRASRGAAVAASASWSGTAARRGATACWPSSRARGIAAEATDDLEAAVPGRRRDLGRDHASTEPAGPRRLAQARHARRSGRRLSAGRCANADDEAVRRARMSTSTTAARPSTRRATSTQPLAARRHRPRGRAGRPVRPLPGPRLGAAHRRGDHPVQERRRQPPRPVHRLVLCASCASFRRRRRVSAHDDVPPSLLAARRLRHKRLKSRLVFGAHTANMAEDGLPGERHRALLRGARHGRGGDDRGRADAGPRHRGADPRQLPPLGRCGDPRVPPHDRGLPGVRGGDDPPALPRRPARRSRQLLPAQLVALGPAVLPRFPTAATR